MPKLTDIKSLQARWDRDSDKTAAINKALRINGSSGLVDLVEKHDGRYDLRGFPLDGMIPKRNLACIDFSYMVFSMPSLMISMCQVDDCLFVGAAGNPPIFRGTFTRCDFSKTAVKISELRGDYSDCIFKETKLTKSYALQSTFTRCDFSACKAAGANFAGVKLTDCILHDSNLNEANLMSTEFIECDLCNMKATGATYSESSIFSSCKNLDPAMIERRNTLLSDRPQVMQ